MVNFFFGSGSTCIKSEKGSMNFFGIFVKGVGWPLIYSYRLVLSEKKGSMKIFGIGIKPKKGG